MEKHIDLNKLDEPFDTDELTWKIQRSGRNQKGIWALVVPYVKASAIEKRLDMLLGKDNWKNEPYQKGANGGLQCGISIRVDEEWITKWDGADNTQYEGIKGGMSDAFKRAARKWGLGRYLTKVKPAFAQIFDDPRQGEYRDVLKEKREGRESKTNFSWNPPGLPSFCFLQNSAKKEDRRTWQEKADDFQEDNRRIQETARQPQPEESEEKKEHDRLISRIQEEIKKVQHRQIRIGQNGRSKSAFVYLNRKLWEAKEDWQKLHDLEVEIAGLLEEWEREAA